MVQQRMQRILVWNLVDVNLSAEAFLLVELLWRCRGTLKTCIRRKQQLRHRSSVESETLVVEIEIRRKHR